MSFETVVQTVVYDQLTASVALMASVEGVYDAVPETETFPYITIGDDAHVEWDTSPELGSNVSITIHTWSRGRGRRETKEIQGYIYDALNRVELTATGYSFAGIDFEQSDSFLDADGLTRHGISTFRILIEKT
jgi:hypothetical protein